MTVSSDRPGSCYTTASPLSFAGSPGAPGLRGAPASSTSPSTTTTSVAATTQQCSFVTGLTSKLSDYEIVDEYHSAFKQAAEGLANVFDQQQPDLLARYDSDAGESAQSLLTISDWLRRRTTLLKHINVSRAKEATSVSLPPAEGVTGGTAQTPERNGITEKANHVIVTRARVMMIVANLPACL